MPPEDDYVFCFLGFLKDRSGKKLSVSSASGTTQRYYNAFRSLPHSKSNAISQLLKEMVSFSVCSTTTQYIFFGIVCIFFHSLFCMSNAIVIFFVVFSSTNGVKDWAADSLSAFGILLYEVSVSTTMKLSWQIIYLFDIMLTFYH